MKISKNNLSFVIFFFVLSIGAVFFNKNYRFVSNEDEREVLNGKEQDQSMHTNANGEMVSDYKLSITPEKCIGCGACIMEAPNNFRMNFDSRKAEVASNNNLDGAEVREAIKACPTKAINL